MMTGIVWTLWLVGAIVLGYGVFAAPSYCEGWYQKDRPFFRIRVIGGGLILLSMALAVVGFYLR